MDTVTKKVLNTIKKHRLVQPGDTVFVALSGGADSVALLHIMLSLRDELRLCDVRALHMNHGLRGQAADDDTAFVIELCRKLCVPLEVEYADVAKEAQNAREGIEEAGRRLRYTFFNTCISGVLNAKIATAHTASDRAETMLFNLARGCGIHGMVGFPIEREHIIRPLYHCSAQEIRHYCRECGYIFREDETNTDITFSRNRIRHKIVPQMCLINEKAEQNILRLSDIAAEEDEFLHTQAHQVLSEAVQDGGVCVAVLLNADRVLIKRALAIAVKQRGIRIEQRHIDELYELAKGERQYVNLPQRMSAKVENGFLRFVPPKPTIEDVSIPILPPCEAEFQGVRYQISLISQSEYQNTLKIHKNLFNFCISYDMISGGLNMRSRRAGDVIRPHKRGHAKTLKKLYCETKIPLEMRHKIPLICDGDGILAVLGAVVSDRAAVNDSTQQILYFKKVSV